MLDGTRCELLRFKRLYKCKACGKHSWGNARKTENLPQEDSCGHECKQKVFYNNEKKAFEVFIEHV
jgi:hypothetical protein